MQSISLASRQAAAGGTTSDAVAVWEKEELAIQCALRVCWMMLCTYSSAGVTVFLCCCSALLTK